MECKRTGANRIVRSTGASWWRMGAGTHSLTSMVQPLLSCRVEQYLEEVQRTHPHHFFYHPDEALNRIVRECTVGLRQRFSKDPADQKENDNTMLSRVRVDRFAADLIETQHR